jgi:hypothetical protein
MRGWSSIFAGFLLLGIAYWAFATDGFGASMLMCAAAAAFFLFRGAQRLELDATGDPTAVADFVSDPAEAIVDTVTERLDDWLGEGRTKPAEEEFDPDAAVARYLAQRGTEPASPAPAASSPSPVRTFGRKGV